MPNPSQNRLSSSLEFSVESLENRRLLAVDVSVVGGTIKVTGDEMNDFVEIYESGGEIVVFDGTVHGTGLATADKLLVDLKDGDDDLYISNDVRVEKTTTLKLGNGENSAYLGGVHAKIKLLGGKDVDNVVVAGVLPLKRAALNLKSGNDTLEFAIDGYADAIEDLPISEEEAIGLLEKPPKFSFNLGAGDDSLALTLGGSPVGDETIDDVLEFFEVDSIEELIVELESLADDFGITSTLKILKINGAQGQDTFHPGGMSQLLSAFGAKIKGFEIDGFPLSPGTSQGAN